jgi:hypothetical protein
MSFVKKNIDMGLIANFLLKFFVEYKQQEAVVSFCLLLV